MLATFLIFAAVDAVIIALAVPLLRRRIKPNDLYGLRVQATFADEWVWYEANAQTARDMLVLGLAHLGLTALLPLVPGVSEAAYALGNVAILLIGVVGMAVIGWRRAERLLADRRAATTLEDLVNRLTPENRHGETDTGTAVGNEVG